mgnify:CR=1 FL=1
MPQLDLGSVLGPQGPKGDPGNQGTVGPRGPQGEQGDAGKDATINGVNALTIETGDGLEATMTGSAYNLKLTDNTLNAVRVVPTFTRPNLLDNWYFGNPVDQRGGYISLQGVPVYNDAACTSLIGNQIETAATCIKSGTNYERRINGQGGGFVKAADVVRGYTGNGYGVDRWLIGAGSNGTLQLTESGLKIARTDGPMYLAHRILKTQIPEGSALTYSVLTTSGLFSISFVVKNDTYHEQSVGGGISLGWNYTPAEMMELTLVNNTVNSNVTIKAAKLELGPTQTLAHQDAAGNWVLNEVPEYGGQLRRCQMYCRPIPHKLDVCLVGGTYYAYTEESFEEMRTKPVSLTNLVGKNVSNMTDNVCASITNVYTWNKYGGVAIQLSQNPNTDIVFLDSMNYLISADL